MLPVKNLFTLVLQEPELVPAQEPELEPVPVLQEPEPGLEPPPSSGNRWPELRKEPLLR
jgi:hypothetical protein